MKLIIVLLALLSSCTSLKEDNKPDSRPVVRLLTSKNVEIFEAWAKDRSIELCSRFHLPNLTSIYLIYSKPTIVSTSGNEVMYIAGEFYKDSKVIVIYALDNNLNEIGFEELRHVFNHEFLHYLDYVNCTPCPVDQIGRAHV